MNRIATDQRQTVISSNDRLRHYVPENRCRKTLDTRDPEICAPYETRRDVIHASCSIVFSQGKVIELNGRDQQSD